MDLKEVIKNLLPDIENVRQRLHENAELAFNEFKTQRIINDYIGNLKGNFTIKTYAKTGIAATMNTDEECLAVRADMDALPVNGISHACGHDYHMAVALGVMQTLTQLKYDKSVKFIFQPAEEGVGGALPMIKEGVLENPRVRNVIGFHVWPEVPVGTIEVSPGPSMASIDDFHITFKGKGGHAAMPHKCLNPIYPALDFIETINIKSRIEQNPLTSHVVTVSSIQCGSAPNVIADDAKVMGTVRTFDKAQREKLHGEIVNTAKLSADKFGCKVDMNYEFQYPPLISDNSFTQTFISKTSELLGGENVLPLEKTFASEDFSFFADAVPSVHFRLGIADEKKGQHPLHSPHFDAAQDTLFYGIYIIANFILSIDDNIIK